MRHVENSRKTVSKKSGQKKKSRKSKFQKGKVQIPASRIILLCLAVILVCLVLLFISIKSAGVDSNKEKKVSKTIENTVEEKPLDKKPQVEIRPPVEEKKPASEEKKQVNNEKRPAASEKKAENEKKALEEKRTENDEKRPVSEEKNSVNEKRRSDEVKPGVQNEKPKAETKPAVQEKKPAEVPASVVQKSNMFPPAVNKAQLVFVFDDGGQNLNQLERFLKMPFPFTVAVLPGLSHSVQAAQAVRQAGKELILHQPMQAINANVNPGPGAITPDMDEEQIISVLFRNIMEIGPIEGLNNHEGSAITADAEKMAVVLKVASEEGIYFLDSRTNVETKVPYVASEMGYSYYERNVFLDNVKTREAVLGEINKGIKIANKNGSAILIGHIWSADLLPAILEEIYPELVSKGYVFTVVSKCNGRK